MVSFTREDIKLYRMWQFSYTEQQVRKKKRKGLEEGEQDRSHVFMRNLAKISGESRQGQT